MSVFTIMICIMLKALTVTEENRMVSSITASLSVLPDMTYVSCLAHFHFNADKLRHDFMFFLIDYLIMSAQRKERCSNPYQSVSMLAVGQVSDWEARS